MSEADRMALETIRYWRSKRLPAKCAWAALTGETVAIANWDSVRRLMVKLENGRRWKLINSAALPLAA